MTEDLRMIQKNLAVWRFVRFSLMVGEAFHLKNKNELYFSVLELNTIIKTSHKIKFKTFLLF